MEQWAINTLPLDRLGNIVLEKLANGGLIICPPATFASAASSLSIPPTYAELSALPIAAAGWQQYFEAWKAAGYIS